MMYRCCKCGKLFPEQDIKLVGTQEEDYMGMPCFSEIEVSPCCKADFTIATHCENHITRETDKE